MKKHLYFFLMFAIIMPVALLFVACKKEYTINYMVDGQVWKSVKVEANQPYHKEDAPDKDGYTFDGWYISETSDTKFDFSKYLDGNVTVYARYKQASYAIIYHLDGGHNDADNPTSFGMDSPTITADDLNDPQKTGYTFDGWYANAELTQPFVEIPHGTTADVNIYAKWRAVSYSITYHLNGGEIEQGANPSSYTTEQSFALANPTRTAYTFGGWYDNADFTGTAISSIAKGSHGDKNLYAKWNAITYTITFRRINNNKVVFDGEQMSNNSGTRSLNYTADESLTLPIASKQYCESVYWKVIAAEDSTGSWTENANVQNNAALGTNNYGNIYLDLQWIWEQWTVKMISLNKDGLEMPFVDGFDDEITIRFNQHLSEFEQPLPIPETSTTGYVFDMWCKNNKSNPGALGEDPQFNENYASKDATIKTFFVYAKWKGADIVLTLDAMGGTWLDGTTVYSTKTETKHFNTASTYLPQPQKTGYEFIGWKVVSGLDSTIARKGTQTSQAVVIDENTLLQPTDWYININAGGPARLEAQWEEAFSDWDGTTSSLPAAVNNIITITTAQQFAAFRDAVNAGDTFEGKTIRLATGIDLNNLAWTPIGEGARKPVQNNTTGAKYTGVGFAGEFDGNNHTIKNLNNTGFVPTEDRLGYDNPDYMYSYGLFAVTDTGANIHDLTLENVDIDTTRYAAAIGDSVAALVGFSAGSLIVNNVTVSGTIKGIDAVGGIVGRAYDQNDYAGNEVFTVTNCTNNASIIAASSSGKKASGIVGFVGEAPHNSTNTITISNCTNNGSISGGLIAGIAIYSYQTNNPTMDDSLQNYVFEDNTNTYNQSTLAKYTTANSYAKHADETITMD